MRTPKAPKQATAAQVAAPQAASAASRPAGDRQRWTEAFNRALAYAPAASSPVDRSNIVAASAPIPRSARPAPRNAAAAATESTPWSPRERRVRAA